MTSLLHGLLDDSGFERRRQAAELDYLASSRVASQTLAKNYAGLPFEPLAAETA